MLWYWQHKGSVYFKSLLVTCLWKYIQWNLSNPTHQGTRKNCRIVQDVGILRCRIAQFPPYYVLNIPHVNNSVMICIHCFYILWQTFFWEFYRIIIQLILMSFIIVQLKWFLASVRFECLSLIWFDITSQFVLTFIPHDSGNETQQWYN